MAFNLGNLQEALREFWMSPIDQRAVDEMGAMWKTMAKGSHSQIGGGLRWASDGDGQGVITFGGSQNVGSDTDFSFDNSADVVKRRPIANAAVWSAFWRMNEDEASLAAQGGVQGNPVLDTLRTTREGFHCKGSAYLWQDGRGGLARISAINGATLTLINRQQVSAFELGDFLSVYERAGYIATNPGVPATPRVEAAPGTAPRVVGRNQAAGTITLDTAIATTVPGSVVDDIIGIRSWRPLLNGNRLARAGLYGVRTYVAGSFAEQALTSLGIDRTVDPVRLAGVYEEVRAETPDEVVFKIQELAGRYGINPDIIYTGTDEHRHLARDFKEQREIPPNLKRGVYGTVGFAASMPNGKTATIVTDQKLWDFDSNDRLWFACESRHWGIVTDPAGIGWRSAGRTGSSLGAPIINTDGKGDLVARYSMTGNVYCANPFKNILIRVKR